MATMVVYSDQSDGSGYGADPSYATARSTAWNMSPTSNFTSVGQALISGSYYCWELFLAFDTSLVAAPTSATLSLKSAADYSTTDFTIEVRLYDWGATLDFGDWVPGASLVQTIVATYDTVNGWTAETYNDLTEVALLANLNLSGFTRVLLNSSRHRLGNTPVGDEYVQAYTSYEAGTSKDPKLTIIGDVGDPGTPGPVPDDDNVIPPFQQTVAP